MYAPGITPCALLNVWPSRVRLHWGRSRAVSARLRRYEGPTYLKGCGGEHKPPVRTFDLAHIPIYRLNLSVRSYRHAIFDYARITFFLCI